MVGIAALGHQALGDQTLVHDLAVHGQGRPIGAVGSPLRRATQARQGAGHEALSVAEPAEADALLQLSGMSQPTVTFQDLDELRAEISDLRGRLEELRSFVHTELNLLKRQSTQSENK